MGTHAAMQAVKADVEARFAGKPLGELRTFLELASPAISPASVGESGSPERIVAIATARVYQRRYAESVKHLSCRVLAAMSEALTDEKGYYLSSVACAESDAIQYDLIEKRHYDEMALADGLPSDMVGAVEPCGNHV